MIGSWREISVFSYICRSVVKELLFTEAEDFYFSIFRKKTFEGTIEGIGYLCGCNDCKFNKGVNARPNTPIITYTHSGLRNPMIFSSVVLHLTLQFSINSRCTVVLHPYRCRLEDLGWFFVFSSSSLA